MRDQKAETCLIAFLPNRRMAQGDACRRRSLVDPLPVARRYHFFAYAALKRHRSADRLLCSYRYAGLARLHEETCRAYHRRSAYAERSDCFIQLPLSYRCQI